MAADKKTGKAKPHKSKEAESQPVQLKTVDATVSESDSKANEKQSTQPKTGEGNGGSKISAAHTGENNDCAREGKDGTSKEPTSAVKSAPKKAAEKTKTSREVRPGLVAKLLFVAVCGGTLAGYFLLHQFSMPAEAALRLSEGQLILNGLSPYSDFLDNVPPFYLYMNVLPMALSHMTYCHPIAIANLLLTFLFVVSSACLAWLSEIPGRRNPLLTAVWPILIALALTTFIQLVHFGQSTQVLFLLLCPYLACRACTMTNIRVPRELATIIGATLCVGLAMDCYFAYFFFLMELCLLAGLFPWYRRRAVVKNYLGVELRVPIYIMSIAIVGWLLVPNPSNEAFLNTVAKINDYMVNAPLAPLSYWDTCTDTRPQIYLTTLLLALALPQGRRSILVRLFGLASILALGLMLLHGATLAYQTYMMTGFAAMALAASLPRQPVLKRLFAVGNPFSHFSPFSRFSRMTLPAVARRQPGLVVTALFALTAAAVYSAQYFSMAKEDRYDLSALHYNGVADRRDLTILSEVVEQNSAVDDPVAIISLGARPGFPLLTQLRRQPALFMTWGYAIHTFNELEQPMYGDTVQPLRLFGVDMYRRISHGLGPGPGAPKLVLVDEDETRQTFDKQGIDKVLNEYYTSAGMASIKAMNARDGHPPLEYVGYRAAMDVYKRKPAAIRPAR